MNMKPETQSAVSLPDQTGMAGAAKAAAEDKWQKQYALTCLYIEKTGRLEAALGNLVDAVNIEFSDGRSNIGGKTGPALIAAVDVLVDVNSPENNGPVGKRLQELRDILAKHLTAPAAVGEGARTEGAVTLFAEVEAYFATVTDEQLAHDLKNSDFDLYNQIGRVIGSSPTRPSAERTDGEALREASKSLVDAIAELAEIKEQLTYFERSPTKDPECHRRWVNLNEAIRAVKECLSAHSPASKS